MFSLTTLAAAVLTTLPAPDPRPADFDFWIGAWDVANSRLDQSNGQWNSIGSSTARIRPVAGGRALLEEWDGQQGPIQSTFGMSLRWFDPTLERWVILLNWPGGNNPNPRFSQMHGGFTGEGEQARGEFFPPPLFEGPGTVPARTNSTRFTFSKPLADSCQWDMASPNADGTFTTTWIMEFTRTGSPEEADDSVQVASVPDDCPCTADGARDMDTLHGDWTGTGQRLIDDEWTDSTATLLSTPAVRGCLTFHELTEAYADQTLEHFEAWAFDTQREQWGGYQMASSSDQPTGFVSEDDDNAFVTTPFGRASRRPNPTRTHYAPQPDGTLTVTLQQRLRGDWTPIATYELTKSDG